MKNTYWFVGALVLYTLVFSLVTYMRVTSPVIVGLTVVGLLIGFILPLFLDALIPRLMDGSAKASPGFAKDVLSQGAANVAQGNVYIESQKGSPLRSYPLLFGYVLAAIFVISSTQNWLGRGVVLGLGLSLVLDIVISRNPTVLRARWFSIFHTRLNDKELEYFVWTVVVGFGLLTFLAAFV